MSMPNLLSPPPVTTPLSTAVSPSTPMPALLGNGLSSKAPMSSPMAAMPPPASGASAPMMAPPSTHFPGGSVLQAMASPPPAAAMSAAPMLAPQIPTTSGMPSLTAPATTASIPPSSPTPSVDPDDKFTEAELVQQYIALRDERKRVEKEHKELLEARFDKRMDQIECTVKGRLDRGNMSQFKTPEGTAFKKMVTRYSVGDGEQLFSWIEQTGNTDMLKKDIRQDPVREYFERTGEVPPGIAVYSEVVVQFRK